MIIHPLSDMNLFAAGQPYEPIAANFPGLKHFFKCDEATAATQIVDSISALTLTGTGLILTNNADGTVTLSAAIDTIVSGTIASPGTKKMVLIIGEKSSSTLSICTLGDSANGNNYIRSSANSGAPTTPQIKSGGTLVTGTAGLAGNGSAHVRCLVVDWGTDGTGGTFGLSPFDFDGTTWTARTAVSIAALTGMTAIDQVVSLGTNLRPAFIQLWYFTSVPGNIRNAVTWMYAMAMTASTGYRKLAYPGWAGLS